MSIAYELGPDGDEQPRPSGPLTNPERNDAVRALILAALDLHSPRPMQTRAFIDGANRKDEPRFRRILHSLPDRSPQPRESTEGNER